ncbi:MAG: OmpA family protein, partial [Nitrospirae bacterium]|nr:OmpA family protein [Nitrospirota bacterium]
MLKPAILATSLVAVAGCSTYIKQPVVCTRDGWYGYVQSGQCPGAKAMAAPAASDDMAARLAALERERQRLADELAATQRQLADRDGQIASLSTRDPGSLESQLLAARRDRNQLASKLAAMQSGAADAVKLAGELAAAKQRVADLERQLAAMGSAAGDKDKLAAELAAAKHRIAELEGQLDQSKGSLAKAEKNLLKALQPEISKGTVSVHQSGDALTINLASGLLFDSGQDQLKDGDTDALKRVGGVLKDFPEKRVHVAGYTDNIAIRSTLKKKYPSNKELSAARANSAAQALRAGGVNGNLSAAGHGDINPIASDSTETGRAKNRRV